MSERERLLRQVVLRVIRQCPQCQRPFAGQDVQFLGQMDETWLFSLYCRSCQVLAVVGLAVTPAAELATEGGQDAGQSRPISADDVLDMHLFLAQLSDFPDLSGSDD